MKYGAKPTDGSAILLVMMLITVVVVWIGNIWYATSLAVEIAQQRQTAYQQKNVMEAALMYASLWAQENIKELTKQYEKGISTWKLAYAMPGEKGLNYTTDVTLTVQLNAVHIAAQVTGGSFARAGSCEVRIEEHESIKSVNKKQFFVEKWQIG